MWCTKSAAERRYLSRVLVSMAGYVLAIAGVSWMFAHRHPQGATVYLLALLPALPIFACIAILGIYLSEEKDEFVRTVLVKSRLRVLRAEKNWSQADLAERLEVSRQSVNAIETGKFDPSLPLAFRLARLFGMTIEEIFSVITSKIGRSLDGEQRCS